MARVRAMLAVCGVCLAGTCVAGVTPVRVTGSMAGSAEVTDHASGATDSESFDAPLRVSDAGLASTTTQRTRTASVGGQSAQAWSQCDAGATASGGLRASVMAFAAQAGTQGGACERAADATTTQTTEFRVTGRAQAYRFRGTITGVREPGVGEDQQKRRGVVRLVGASGVVHEFDTASAESGAPFDASGTLEPGTYRVEVTTQARAASGQTASADPMIASVQWTLEPTAKPGAVAAAK